MDDDFSKDSNALYSEENANRLLFDLIRANLRVTYTTGEEADIGKFTKKDLSEIKYIFSDLDFDLLGRGMTGGHKSINSIIVSKIKKMNKHLREKEITVYINSRNIDSEYYGKDGIKHLEESLHEIWNNKFKITKYKHKNKLPAKHKKILKTNNILYHQRNLIITKAIEIEEEIGEKMGMCIHCQDALDFNTKTKLLRIKFSRTNTDSTIAQIHLIKELRNKLAHKRGLDEKLNSPFIKTLKTVMGEKIDVTGNFKSFAQLVRYTNSLDKLKKGIRALTKNAPYK